MGWGLLIAGIAATINGALGVVDYFNEYEQAQADIETAEENLLEMYDEKFKQLDLQFENAKEEANLAADQEDLKADLIDQGTDITEVAASDEYNAGIENLQLEQEANLFSWNNALMQAGVNEGTELSQIATSGIRAGSSMAQAVELEAAVNNAALALEMDQTKRKQDLTINSLSTNLLGENFNIYQSRESADLTRFNAQWNREQYLEGGNRFNEWQKQSDIMLLERNQKWDQLETQYKRNEDNKYWGAIGAFFNKGNSAFESTYRLTEEIYNASNG